MRTLATRTLAIAAIGLSVFASTASAQTVITQWNFNNLTPYATVVGTGTIGGYGQSQPAAPLSSILYNGALVDSGTTISGTSYNRAFTVNPPLTSTLDDTTGVWFSANTTGMSPGQAVKLSWSQTIGFRSSRFWQVLVSTTGGTTGFSAPSGGTGSSISQFVTGYTGTTPSTSLSRAERFG